MIRKRVLIFAMCAALACLLAGCGNSAGNAVSNAASKVGEVVSKAGEGVSDAVSRMESALDGDSSRTDDPGAVDSGDDGFLGDESRMDSSSGLLGDGLSSGSSGLSSDRDASGLSSDRDTSDNSSRAS